MWTRTEAYSASGTWLGKKMQPPVFLLLKGLYPPFQIPPPLLPTPTPPPLAPSPSVVWMGPTGAGTGQDVGLYLTGT